MQYGPIHFSFGVRGDEVKPVLSWTGDNSLSNNSSDAQFQVWKHPNGDYYLYFRQPKYSSFCTFVYFAPGCEVKFTEDQPGGSNLIWNSANGDVQFTRFGHDTRIDTAGGHFRMQADSNNYIHLNKNGDVTFFKDGSGHFNFYRSSDNHTAIQGKDQAIIKFLNSSDTVQIRNRNDNGYATLEVGDCIERSNREEKKNIVKFEESVLDKILTTPVYQYHLNADLDEEMKRLGILMDEAPAEIVAPTGVGVSIYAMVSYLWKANQELIAENAEMNILLKDLKERVEQLEAQAE
ncbi:tail fiber domain-containing protein (plasmid) [Bacillus carboniphilus]|uniref:Tail fiber domain-containing protein n=1 Tax=Bacillus carboniphilus TaxID=86663 RepID=A0ABY9K1A1_9BACI|nr:tail fiber domain-containing protein [Bacillus carboniphilus]WLR44488.1 tail fiber domain-containing protein [Bacillus carboniphilus]